MSGPGANAMVSSKLTTIVNAKVSNTKCQEDREGKGMPAAYTSFLRSPSIAEDFEYAKYEYALWLTAPLQDHALLTARGGYTTPNPK